MTLIEEIRKNANLPTKFFQTPYQKLNGHDIIGQLSEVTDIIMTKHAYIKDLFGLEKFDDVMLKINELDSN